MTLTNKNILLISPEPWTHLFVSKHHYAGHLAAQGNRVYFLNPPGNVNTIWSTDMKGLWVLDYRGFVRGMRHFPSLFRKWLTRRKWEGLQSQASVKFDVIWSFDNSVFYDMNALPESVLKISHIVDLNQDFQTQRATSTANICFGVIPAIVDRLSLFNPNSHLIRHGVMSHGMPTTSPVLAGENVLKALYFGNLDMPYIDWMLFKKVASNFRKIDFLFLGNASAPELIKPLVCGSPNIYFMAPVPANELASYMSMSDILVMAYTSEYYLNYASPHKLSEYLSSGKPIVATYSADYEETKHLLYMSKSKDEWVSNFKYVLSNLSECSSDKLVSLRREFAMQNTYDKQIGRIESLIKGLNDG